MTGPAPRVDGNVLEGVSATALWALYLDRVGVLRRGRPSFTLLEFG
ncbi:hypothetical protein QGN32_17995 [Mycolicibacterium sp. ND9-15]|nr:hypothetical protein [Mycolicibacterium sp. ND9-15]WSE55317.1 hypothetical protein QGN32_17995 [Mycolicibacterium sp. ND9-15]